MEDMNSPLVEMWSLAHSPKFGRLEVVSTNTVEGAAMIFSTSLQIALLEHLPMYSPFTLSW